MNGWEKKSAREGNGEDMFKVKNPEQQIASATDQDTKRRHERLRECLEDENNRQAENRYQMAVDHDFYDGKQWNEDDAAALIARGQAPMVFNKVKPTVNWVLGTEKRTRFDSSVLPREPSDEEGATTKKKVLKYLSDVNRLPFHRSAAFAECVIGGLGWLEDGVNADPTEELLYARSESWRNVLHDSRSRDLAYTPDARYLFRNKVIDMDMACAMFPAHTNALRGEGQTELEQEVDDVWYLGQRLTNARDFDSAGSAGYTLYGARSAVMSSNQPDIGRREQVRIHEAWYTTPIAVKYFAAGDLRGQEFDRGNEEHLFMRNKYRVPIIDAVTKQMRVMLFAEDIILFDGISPYLHRKFPLTPMWCYRNARDGMPYGIVRDIRDPQEDLNKRRSKALYILSNNRIVMDKGAVDDIEELRDEAARPDGVIEKNPNRELRFEKPGGEFQGNLELAQHDENFIQEVSGVTSENLGLSTNATSGKAILARQDQGSIVTANIFDNMRLAVQLQGEKQLSNIEQFYTAAKVVRIVGENQPVEWLEVNKIDPQTGQVLNDITASKADFIVSEQDWRASMRQAALDSLNAMLPTLPPEVGMAVLDLAVDLWDIPNKDEWLQRIRKINGQRDPAKKITPEEEQAMQQQAQKNAMLEQLQLEGLQADVELKKQKAQEAAAKVQTMLADLQAGPEGQDPGVAQLQGQVAELTAQLQDANDDTDRLLFESKQKADRRVAEVESKLEAERMKGLNAEADRQMRADTELRKAEIAKQQAIEVALIQAEQRTKLQAVTGRIDKLQESMKNMGGAKAAKPTAPAKRAGRSKT